MLCGDLRSACEICAVLPSVRGREGLLKRGHVEIEDWRGLCPATSHILCHKPHASRIAYGRLQPRFVGVSHLAKHFPAAILHLPGGHLRHVAPVAVFIYLLFGFLGQQLATSSGLQRKAQTKDLFVYSEFGHFARPTYQKGLAVERNAAQS